MSNTHTTTASEAPANLSAIDLGEFFGDLDAGHFERVISAALSLTAAAVHDHGKPGKVTLEFNLEKIPGTQQLHVEHKLKYARPTLSGKQSEETSRTTPMFVGKGGKLTLAPENQLQMFERKTGAPLTPPGA